jgi:hypothetical protein
VYTTEKHNRVHELTDVELPSPGAPSPLVVAGEDTLVVTYTAVKASSGETTASGPPSADETAVIVVFRQCYAIHFGLPNDETFASHPLADRGLSPYGAFEVESSSWVRGLEMRNRGHPRHDPELFQQLRHWVWTFHDSVLECAAVSYAVLHAQGRPDDLLSQMYALLHDEPRV